MHLFLLQCAMIVWQADREALEAELSRRLQEACDSATQWKEAAERVAAEKAEAETAHAQAAAALADLQTSSSAQLVSTIISTSVTAASPLDETQFRHQCHCLQVPSHT